MNPDPDGVGQGSSIPSLGFMEYTVHVYITRNACGLCILLEWG